MAEIIKCPKCQHKLIQKAKVDSDERIYEKWFWCLNCDYDSRKDK